jgi:hypothetical protein
LDPHIDVVSFRRRVPDHCPAKVCAGLPDIDDGYVHGAERKLMPVILAKNFGHEEIFDVLCKPLANDFRSEVSTIGFRAADNRPRLGSLPKSFELSEISLKVPSNLLGAFYEAGNICAAFSSAEALPEADKLTRDLRASLKGRACKIDVV